jgi:hypothetical protein
MLPRPLSAERLRGYAADEYTRQPLQHAHLTFAFLYSYPHLHTLTFLFDYRHCAVSRFPASALNHRTGHRGTSEISELSSSGQSPPTLRYRSAHPPILLRSRFRLIHPRRVWRFVKHTSISTICYLLHHRYA